jgi:hypothetical protein
MHEDLLKQVETLIQKNIGSYRDLFAKDLGTFSESLKKEYGIIKGNIQSSIDNVLARFEQKLKDKQIENREQIIEDVKNVLWNKISQEVFAHFTEIDQKLKVLENKQTSFEEQVKKDMDEIKKELDTQINLTKKSFNEYIKQYIDGNINMLRNQFRFRFFRKK